MLTRGDLAVINHDVLDRVQVAARVKAVDGYAVTLDTAVTIEASTSYGIRFRLADETTLVRPVVGPASGETNVLLLPPGAVPATGDLALFGTLGSDSREVIVKAVEVADNLNCRLTLVDHAPQIEAEVDAAELPDWAGPHAEDVVSAGRTGVNFALVSSSTSGSGSAVSSFDVSLGPVNGTGIYVMLLALSSILGSVSLSTPSGWTPLFNTAGSGSLRRFAAFYRTGITAPVETVSWTGADSAAVAHVYRIIGAQGAPEAATPSTGASTTPDPPSLSPSWGAELTTWLAVSADVASGNAPPARPAGYLPLLTNSLESGGSSLVRLSVAQKQANTATENPGAFTLPGSAAWAAATIAIRPEA